MDEGYLPAASFLGLLVSLGRRREGGRRDNSMMYDITAITALMEVDGGVAVGDGDGLAVTGQTDS